MRWGPRVKVGGPTASSAKRRATSCDSAAAKLVALIAKETAPALALLLASTLFATPAHADPLPLRIDFRADATCPSLDVFVDEIRWRTARARLASPEEAALTAEVRVTRRGAERRARLVLSAPSTATIRREIRGESCDEVVSAIALITALAVDPQASTAARRPSPPPAPTAPAKPLPPPPATLPLPPFEPQLLGEPLPALLSPEVPAPPRLWWLGATASAAFAVSPRPLVGGALFVERVLDEDLGASLRLAVEVAGTGDFTVGPGGASFLRAEARAEGCAFAFHPSVTRRLSLVPCVGLEAGGLRSAGVASSTIASTESSTIPWFAAGLLPRLTIDLGAVALEVLGGPLFPFVRRTFVFDRPTYSVYELPSVTWTLGVGGRMSIP